MNLGNDMSHLNKLPAQMFLKHAWGAFSHEAFGYHMGASPGTKLCDQVH